MTSKQLKFQPAQKLEIDANAVGQRLDNYLVRVFPKIPKSHLYRIIRKGEVRVNKGRVRSNYRLDCGDLVRVPPMHIDASAPKLSPSRQLSQELQNRICYEDKSLLVIDKPSGLAVHGGSGINLGLIEALRKIYPENSYLELVHRLDRETSGCIMIAKKRSMLTHLHSCLKQNTINKSYLAVVNGKWPGQKVVKAPLAKWINRSGEKIIKVDPDGKACETHFKVLKYLKDATLLQVSPKTGRTHQIRVHCEFVGHPIIGDTKYGGGKSSRLLLHAHSLTIPDELGDAKLIQTELPNEFKF